MKEGSRCFKGAVIVSGTFPSHSKDFSNPSPYWLESKLRKYSKMKSKLFKVKNKVFKITGKLFKKKNVNI